MSVIEEKNKINRLQNLLELSLFNLLNDKEKCLKCFNEFFKNINPKESNKYIYTNGANFRANLIFNQISQYNNH